MMGEKKADVVGVCRKLFFKFIHHSYKITENFFVLIYVGFKICARPSEDGPDPHLKSRCRYSTRQRMWHLYIYSLLTRSPTNTPEHKMQKKQGFIVDFTHAQTWKTSNSYLEKHGRYYETPVFSPHLWLSGLRPGSVGGLQAPTN